MGSRRQATEQGHRRKFLVVVDDTPECDRAVIYAARRAANTGGVLVLLFVVDDTEFRNFIGVEQMMRSEARAEAEFALGKFSERARVAVDIDPELVIAEGAAVTEILKLIETDRDIAILVLAAAAAGTDGPGPLVSGLAGRGAGTFPVPITIVPGHLSDEDIAALA